MIKLQTIPDPLKPLTQYPQWVIWERIPMRDLGGNAFRKRDLLKMGMTEDQINALPFGEKTEKVPIDYRTLKTHNAHDPAIHMAHTDAVRIAAALPENYGVGFVFTRNDPFFFVDIDECADATQQNGWSPRANELMWRLQGACVEVSQSGRGLHIIGMTNELPPRSCKYKNEFDLYTEDRFVALTGKRIGGSALINCTQSLAEIVNTYLPPDTATNNPVGDGPDPDWNGHTDDGELIEHALTSVSAMHTLTGKATFADLWNGNVLALGRSYPDDNGREYDASKADMALAQHLAFWTGRDAGRIERLMRQSALARDKWDERPEWLANTISKACSMQREIHNRGRDETGSEPMTLPEFNDKGLATRFDSKHGRDFVYVPGLGWYHWTGQRWKSDVEDIEARKAMESIGMDFKQTAATLPDKEKQQALFKFGVKVGNVEVIRKGLRSAQTKLAQPLKRFDNHHLDVNCGNGTFELGTDAFRPHQREDKLTAIISHNYRPDAAAPTFFSFLERVIPDSDVRNFLQRAIGYSITGMTREQILFFCHGGGANGKSTFIEAITHVFGEYSRIAPQGILLSNQKGVDAWDILVFRGARLVTSQETPEGGTFNESLLKWLTGGDQLTGRKMYSDTQVVFTPTHKLWLCSNHRPRIKGTDDAIWRRIMLVPFDVQIPKEERDPQLLDKLKKEAEGILVWAIEGAREWLRNGLNPPAGVVDASNEYRSQEDLVRAWLCERVQNVIENTETSAVLYDDFMCYWRRQGEAQLPTQATWGRRMNQLGYSSTRTNMGSVYRGLKLASEYTF